MRNFIDEGHIIGHPPFGDFALEISQHIFFAQLCTLIFNNDEQRPLIPFRMGQADNRSLGNAFSADGDIFILNG